MMAAKKKSLAERLKILDKISAETNAKTGKVIAGRPSQIPELKDKLTNKFIASKCVGFNAVTGGGYPRGKCTLIAGPPDSGKTGRCLEDIAFNQENDKEFIAVWLESENSVDIDMMQSLYNIDLDRLYFMQFDANLGAEEMLDNLDAVIKAVPVDMVVINSLKSLVPTKILEEDMGSQTPAVQARVWSKMSMKFGGPIADNSIAFVLITHVYSGIGPYASPSVISGGVAIRYLSSVILSFSKKTITDTDPIGKTEGLHIEVSVKKNHCKPAEFPYGKFEYYVVFGKGTDIILSWLPLLVKAGIIIQRGGGNFEITKEDGTTDQKIKGKAVLRTYLMEHSDVMDQLLSRLPAGSAIETLSDEEIKEIEAEIAADEEAIEEQIEITRKR